MYAYKINYKLKNNKEWQSHVTNFYDNSFDALRDAERFESQQDCEMFSHQLLKK